jgi:hypothetical protein
MKDLFKDLYLAFLVQRLELITLNRIRMCAWTDCMAGCVARELEYALSSKEQLVIIARYGLFQTYERVK